MQQLWAISEINLMRFSLNFRRQLPYGEAFDNFQVISDLDWDGLQSALISIASCLVVVVVKKFLILIQLDLIYFCLIYDVN